MAKIIVVRHAESYANNKGIFQGQTYDSSLTPLGKLQAIALADSLKNIKIDRIIVSPLKRTYETAKPISEKLAKNIDFEGAIIETNHGIWEGKKKSFVEANFRDIYNAWLARPSTVIFPKGEAFTETIDRVKDYILGTNWEGTTLIVTHDNVIRILVCLAKDRHIDKMWKIRIDPAALTMFEVKGVNGEKKLKLVKLNKTAHIKNLKANIFNHAL